MTLIPPDSGAEVTPHPHRCDSCGAAEFSYVDWDMGMAVLGDGGHEYWLIVTVKCDRCGRTYIGDYGAIDGLDQERVRWRDQADS
jgi:hypothetical protein